MKKYLALLLALCMVFGLAACGQSAAPAASPEAPAEAPAEEPAAEPAEEPAEAAAEPAAEGNLVGVAMPTKDLQRWNQDGENMKAQLEAAGYEVDLQFGANDIATQVSQIENMIANGCKVLVIASIDGDSLGTVLAQAKEAGIPVIAYDRLIMNSDAVSYYATFDNWLVGVTQGNYIRDALDLDNAEGPFNIEFITGDPGDNNINFFFDGAMSVLQPYLDEGKLVCPSGQTEKAVVATANWATDAAQARFETILAANYADGTPLHAVLASNDSTALGVENALAASYDNEVYPVITGQDCDIAIMKNLIEGRQAMSVFKDTRTLAAKVVEMVDALMKGAEPPVNDTETYDNGTGIIPSFLCEPVSCTVDNYAELLIDSGYYTYETLGVEAPEGAAAEPAEAAAEPAAEGSLVGVAMPTKDLQRWNQDGENMKAQLEAAGYEVDLQFGANDIATQVSQIENMIANGCKVLVIASIDGDSLGTVLAQAKEAGIPVIAYDRLIMNSDAVSYYATFDNWLVGVTQGNYIRDALDLDNAEGPFNIEFITGDPGDNNINFFFDGAMSVLQPYLDEGKLVCPSGQTEKAVVATANWATDAAQARFETILAANYADGTPLHAVLASNDSTALGVENALAASYDNEVYPVITGQDCDMAIMKNLVEGRQAMSVFKDTRTLAAKVVEMVDALMKGAEPPVNDTETYDNGTGIIPSFLCEPVSCTVDNYVELLIDSGYYTFDDIGVEAPAADAEPAEEPAEAAAEPAAEGSLVGVAMPTKDLQRWNQDGENMKAQLEAAGYEVDLQFGANDIATQVSQIENMIANGCKVLVIASIDGDSLGTVLAQAKEAGIPVIAYDRLIMNSDAVSYYATFDNWLVGVTQGNYIRDALDLDNAEGPFNIEFITGDPGDNNINFFFDGAMSVLQPYLDEGKLVCPSGQTEKAVVATANWATDAAQARFETILAANYSDGTPLHAVLASNDSTALGVENALAASYDNEVYPVITGQDCDMAIMKNLVEGRQAMSVFKDTRTLAAKVVEMVDALMKGAEPPVNDTETYDNGTGIIPSFLCEPVSCTVDNYVELLIDSGYYTFDDIGVEAPAA